MNLTLPNIKGETQEEKNNKLSFCMSIRVRRLLIFWSGGRLGGNLGIIFLLLLRP